MDNKLLEHFFIHNRIVLHCTLLWGEFISDERENELSIKLNVSNNFTIYPIRSFFIATMSFFFIVE